MAGRCFQAERPGHTLRAAALLHEAYLRLLDADVDWQDRAQILIVEFANQLQERRKSKLEAVIEASGTRRRPILMTTAATVFAHLPLVFAKGPGAGAPNSIGIMLVSGMIIGTAFTLFDVPSIYMLVAKTHTALALDGESDLSEPAEVAA